MTALVTKLAASPANLGIVVPDAPFDLDVKLCTATYTVSSSAVDADGDIVVPEGSIPHLNRFRNNPAVLWNHDRECPPIAQAINPITKELSWDVGTESIKSTAHFHLMTQESSQCWALVESRILRGASVGYEPVEGKTVKLQGKGLRYKFLEWEPTEWSVCPIPNNPETLLEAVNRQWDGKSLSPSIVKSLMAYVPKSTKVIVSMVQPRRYVKSSIPWVQSNQKNTKGTVMADEATKPVEETKDDSVDTPARPPGAQAIMGFTADVESALANLNTALASVENPDVLSLFESVGSAIEEQVQALRDGLSSIYPDLEVPTDDDGDADDEAVEEVKADDKEEEEKKPEEKSLKKSAPDGEHIPHIQAIQDAGDVMKEMSDSPNIPKSYRMACKGAHGGLMSACDYVSKSFSSKAEAKPEEKPELPEDHSEDKPNPVEEKADDELSEDEVKALKSIASDLAGLRKEVKAVTGKVQ